MTSPSSQQKYSFSKEGSMTSLPSRYMAFEDGGDKMSASTHIKKKRCVSDVGG